MENSVEMSNGYVATEELFKSLRDRMAERLASVRGEKTENNPSVFVMKKENSNTH